MLSKIISKFIVKENKEKSLEGERRHTTRVDMSFSHVPFHFFRVTDEESQLYSHHHCLSRTFSLPEKETLNA